MAQDQIVAAHENAAREPDTVDSVGSMLTRTRAAQGLTLAEVGNKLKFAVRQIEALEADRFDALPRGTFLRGMVRGYARLLEIDPEPLLSRIADQINLPEAEQLAARYNEPVPFSDSSKRLNIVYAVLSLAVLVIAGVVAFEWGASRGKPSDGAAAAHPPAVEIPAAPPQQGAPPAAMAAPNQAPALQTEAPPGNDTTRLAPGRPEAGRAAAPAKRTGNESLVRFRFERDSWVHVVDGSGQVLMSQLNPRGTENSVQGRPPLSLVIGNAQHVRVLFRGEPVDLAPHIKVEVARFTLP